MSCSSRPPAAAAARRRRRLPTTRSSAGGSTQQKTFPNFRIVYDTGTDYLDPGLSYTVQGWEAMWNVYLSLLGYKHVNGPDGATIVPALATEPAAGLVGRPDVHAHAAHGPEVLGRNAGEGQ